MGPTTSRAPRRISRKNAFGQTAGLPPATSIYRIRTASIITAAAPVIWLRVSGIWISPAEIEDVLAGIRSISETAAVLGESEIGLAEIVLYIVPAPGADGSAAVAAARERLSRALPPYKRPRRFEIAHDLPRTATGKVQRNKLREQLRRDPH